MRRMAMHVSYVYFAYIHYLGRLGNTFFETFSFDLKCWFTRAGQLLLKVSQYFNGVVYSAYFCSLYACSKIVAPQL